jgi:hypothetical protein
VGQKRVLVIIVSMLGCAGCANLATEVSKRTDAPQWFKSRVKEIEGDGYPKFSETNMTPRPKKTPDEWAEVRSDLDQAKASIDSDQRAVSPGPLRNTTEWQAAEKKKAERMGVEQ